MRIHYLETEQAKLEAEKALQSMTTELDQLNSVHAETEKEVSVHASHTLAWRVVDTNRRLA